MARTAHKKDRGKGAKRKVSAAARKGWETRRKNEAKRVRAAQKAARTRAENRARKEREHAERSRRAKKGHATRKARAEVRRRLEAMRSIVEHAQALFERGELLEGEGEALIAPEREAMHDAKRELFEAVEYDADDYEAFLDELTDELDLDWHISYGPGEE